MKIQVHINKKTVSIKDRAFSYGDGLFETILIKNKNPIYLQDHINRLKDGCKKLKIAIPNSDLIKKSIKKSIGNTNECIVKIIYTRGLSDYGYGYDSNINPQLYVNKKNKNKVNKKKLISLGYSNYLLNENSYLSQIKHMNRLEQILGFTFAQKNKFDSYILLSTSKKIIECISSNIFFYIFKKNSFSFYTPKLDKIGVDGIAKKNIIKYLKRKKIKIIEKNINKKDINKYHGCFICNSITGIQFVNKIDKKLLTHVALLEELLDKYIYE